MATDVTQRFLNQDKREQEAVVMTIPAILKEGGGRTQSSPTYLQGGEALTAQVIEEDTIVTKAYIVVDEAFPTGALLNVNIAGTDFFIGVDGTATGLTVSTTEDQLFANPQTITVSIAGITGDITTGKARVLLETMHGSIRNGRYAN